MDEWDKTDAAPEPSEETERLTEDAAQSEEQARSRDGARVRQEAAPGRDLYMNVRLLVIMMTVFVFIFTFVARIIVVSGPSMQNTLLGGDVMLVWTLGYNEPKQGDIVVLTQRSYQDDSIVKRVIATEGEVVDVDFDLGVVYVDGQALEEPYIREATYLSEGTEFPFAVPEGCVFLMGDNRNGSRDSRAPELGAVDERCLIGRAVFLLLPGQTEDLGMREWDRIGSL